MLLMVPLIVGSPRNGLLDARSPAKLLSCAAQYVEALIAFRAAVRGSFVPTRRGLVGLTLLP